MDLSSRSISGTTSKDTKHVRGIERSESKKNLNNNLTFSSIQQNIKLATTMLFQRIYIFTILEASYI